MERIKPYLRYVIAVFVAVAIGLIAFFGASGSNISSSNSKANTLGKYSKKVPAELELLINSYYTAYAAGDVASIKAVASPVSDQEASFIQFYSKYIDSMDGLKLYTKKGVTEGSYLVSAYIDYHYVGVDTAAPGLDFFYVTTDASGSLYIDNLYGSFNQTNELMTLDPNVEQLIVAFEQESDVLALQAEVQDAYNKAVASDSNLASLVNETLQAAFIDWNTQYLIAVAEAEKAEQERLAQEAAEAEAAAEAERIAQEEANAYTGKVKGTSVYVRREADSESTKLGTLTKGKEVKIYAQEGDFYKIEFGGVKAYVAAQYIETAGPRDPNEPVPDTTVVDANDKTVITVDKLTPGEKFMVMDSLKVRKDCTTESDHIETVRKGDKITIVESYANGWTKVKTSKNTGYIRTDVLTK